MSKAIQFLKSPALWLLVLQILVGTVVPCLGLWLLYTNLNQVAPWLGGVVVGVCLLAYGYVATRQPSRTKSS